MPIKVSACVSITAASVVPVRGGHGRNGPAREKQAASAARFCGAGVAFVSRVMRRSYRQMQTEKRKTLEGLTPLMPVRKSRARSSQRRPYSPEGVTGPAAIPFVSRSSFKTSEVRPNCVGSGYSANCRATNLATAISVVSSTRLTSGHLASWCKGPRSISGGRRTFSGSGPAPNWGISRCLANRCIPVTVSVAIQAGYCAVFSIFYGGSGVVQHQRTVLIFIADGGVSGTVLLVTNEASCCVYGLVRYCFRDTYIVPVVYLNRI